MKQLDRNAKAYKQDTIINGAMQNLDDFIINSTAGTVYQSGKNTADDPVYQLCSHNGADYTEDSLDNLDMKGIYEKF